MLLYRILYPFVVGIPRLLWRVRVTGGENVPDAGGCVIAPSHRSMMDIPFAAGVTRRRMRFMGKAGAFKVPVLGSIFRYLGAFPVARDGTDRKAVRDSVTMLQSGEALCVFPEGTRQHGSKIQPLQPGAAYLALRSGVPIIPVALAGTEEILRSGPGPFPRFQRVEIVIGAPIMPPPRSKGVVPRDSVDAFSATLAEEMQQVLDDAFDRRGT